MANNSLVNSLAIVGSGYSLYLAAHILIKKQPFGLDKLYLIDLNQTPQDNLIMAMGSMRQLHLELGLPEVEFIRSTRAEINLGFDFSGFKHSQSQLFCDAQYGVNFAGKRFYYLFNKLQMTHKQECMEDYCTSAKLARLGRFTPPSQNPKSVFAGVNYGYRVSEDTYGAFLRNRLHSPKICQLQAQEFSVGELDQGKIKSVTVDGQNFAVDFVIDMTEQQLGKSHISGSENPFNASRFNLSVVKTRQIAEDKKPLTNIAKTPQGLIVSGQFSDRLYQKEFLLDYPDPSSSEQASPLSKPLYSYDTKPWVGNCVALGPGFAVREPIVLDELSWIHSCINNLLSMWPRSQEMAFEANHYNVKTTAEFQRLVELEQLIIFTALGQLHNLTIDMQHRLETYTQRGKVVFLEDEVFAEQQWPVLFNCLGYTPEQQDVSLLHLSSQDIANPLNQFKAVVAKAAAAAPNYADFIAPLHR